MADSTEEQARAILPVSLTPPSRTVRPKARQTPLGSIAVLSRALARGDQATIDGLHPSPLARRLAAGPATADLTALDLNALRESRSITTVEELVAVSDVDRSLGTEFSRALGISAAALAALREAWHQSDEGRRYEARWSDLRAARYALGYRLAAVPDPGDDAAGNPDEPAPVGSAPAAAPSPPSALLIDDYMPSIRDQGDRPTCTAFASVACLEYHLGRQRAAVLDLSEQFQYWSTLQEGHHTLTDAFPRLSAVGVCEEALWPYNPVSDPTSDAQGPPPAQASAGAAAWRCTRVTRLDARSVAAIRSALASGRPVAIGIPVYRSWYTDPNVRLTGNIRLPFPGEVPDDWGHAMTLVGYGDDEDFAGGGYFVVRNSWNAHWGIDCPFGAGYGTLPFSYIARFNWEAWTIER